MHVSVFFRTIDCDYNDTSYYRKMYDLYSFSKYNHGGNGLYSQADKLWWRDKDFVPPYKEPNVQDCYWSRGNGWVVAALVRTLQMLPKTDPHYAEYLQDFRDMCAALLPIQRSDGFWNVSLHDSTNFSGVVAKTWNAMVKDCVHPNGKLGFVQGTGKEPKMGNP